jgi:hypothetical protein
MKHPWQRFDARMKLEGKFFVIKVHFCRFHRTYSALLCNILLIYWSLLSHYLCFSEEEVKLNSILSKHL